LLNDSKNVVEAIQGNLLWGNKTNYSSSFRRLFKWRYEKQILEIAKKNGIHEVVEVISRLIYRSR
jgi:hypothetical protein